MMKDIAPAHRALPVLQTTLIWMAVVFPWVNTLATGPTPGVMSIVVAMGAGALMLLCYRMVRPEDMARGWLVAALLSAVIGLCQYFQVEQHFLPWMSWSEQGEAFGNLRQRNQFATLTNIGLLALLWMVALSSQETHDPSKQAGLFLAVVLLAFGNAAASSRTGLAQLLLIAGLAWCWNTWRRPRQRNVLLVALVAYAIAAFVLHQWAGHAPRNSGVISRLQSADQACTSRLTLWSNMLELISQRPWTGWGWGELDYAHFMTAYEGPRFCELLSNAHNLPLHLAVELGLPLALLLCSVVLWWIWRAQPWRETDATRQLAWGVLALVALHSMLEYPLWYGPFQMAVVLSMVLLWRQPGAGLLHARQTGAQGFAVVLLGLAAYVGWDYHRVSQIYLPVEQRSGSYRDHTLEKNRSSWLFRDQVRFAEFTLTTLTRDNAEQLNAMAHEMLHFSPEAKVVEKLIESAVRLGRDDEAAAYMVRYRAAYPQAYAQWVQARGK